MCRSVMYDVLCNYANYAQLCKLRPFRLPPFRLRSSSSATADPNPLKHLVMHRWSDRVSNDQPIWRSPSKALPNPQSEDDVADKVRSLATNSCRTCLGIDLASSAVLMPRDHSQTTRNELLTIREMAGFSRLIFLICHWEIRSFHRTFWHSKSFSSVLWIRFASDHLLTIANGIRVGEGWRCPCPTLQSWHRIGGTPAAPRRSLARGEVASRQLKALKFPSWLCAFSNDQMTLLSFSFTVLFFSFFSFSAFLFSIQLKRAEPLAIIGTHVELCRQILALPVLVKLVKKLVPSRSIEIHRALTFETSFERNGKISLRRMSLETLQETHYATESVNKISEQTVTSPSSLSSGRNTSGSSYEALWNWSYETMWIRSTMSHITIWSMYHIFKIYRARAYAVLLPGCICFVQLCGLSSWRSTHLAVRRPKGREDNNWSRRRGGAVAGASRPTCQNQKASASIWDFKIQNSVHSASWCFTYLYSIGQNRRELVGASSNSARRCVPLRGDISTSISKTRMIRMWTCAHRAQHLHTRVQCPNVYVNFVDMDWPTLSLPLSSRQQH